MYAAMPFLPSLWTIFVLSFAIECLSLLWTPAKDASIPNLVPRRQLANANSVGLVTTYGTLPLGATLYTVVAAIATGLGASLAYFASHPESLALWLDAGTFTFSAWMVSGLDLKQGSSARLRASNVPKLGIRLALKEARDGFRFLGEHPLVRAMTLGIVMAFAGVGAVISLGPIFARYSLHSGSTGFGFLVIALGVGMGVGMAIMSVVTKVVDTEKVFSGAMIGAAICLFVLASMPTLLLATLFTIPMGVGAGLTWVTGYTMLQENVTDEYRGRTFATLTVSARLALFVALALFPALAAAVGSYTWTIAGRRADVSGTRIALYLAGVVVVAAGLLSRRGLRRHRVAKAQALDMRPRFRKRGTSGLFIVFEGVEGAGKGTQIELARRYVESRGFEVIVTREPGGTGFGDRLRETILDPAAGTVDPRAEALVFAAARAHLVSMVIRPALEAGKVVLSDRFVDSSLAYQGTARGLGEQDVLTLNAWATQGLFPDMVILLHLEPERGLARSEDEPLDRMEQEGQLFLAKVADAYLRIAEEHPERFVVVDADQEQAKVFDAVREALDRVVHDRDGHGHD
jgi:dTMP kinase